MMERTVRPSSLTDYLDCPRRFAARHLRDEVAAAGYTLGIRSPASAGALVGSGVHGGAAWTLQQMRDTGAAGTEADAIEQAIVTLRERIEAEGADWDETTDRVNTAEQQVQRMTKVFRRQVAPQIVPILVEERVEAEFAPGWLLSGQIDAMRTLATSQSGHGIRDTKTGTKAPANAVQYGAYGLLFTAHAYQPTEIDEDYIARVKLSREQPDAVTLRIDARQAMQDAHETLHAIVRDTDEFARRVADPRGLPPPGAFRPNPASALCSARWCVAHGTSFCRSHR